MMVEAGRDVLVVLEGRIVGRFPWPAPVPRIHIPYLPGVSGQWRGPLPDVRTETLVPVELAGVLLCSAGGLTLRDLRHLVKGFEELELVGPRERSDVWPDRYAR